MDVSLDTAMTSGDGWNPSQKVLHLDTGSVRKQFFSSAQAVFLIRTDFLVVSIVLCFM
jgi:hypothetical protein